MVEVLIDFDNKLLGRHEVKALLESEGKTLTRDEVKKELAKKFKAKEELIVVNEIDSNYGSMGVGVNAFIYSKKDDMAKLTPGHIAKRNEAKVVEAPEEAAPATAESEPAGTDGQATAESEAASAAEEQASSDSEEAKADESEVAVEDSLESQSEDKKADESEVVAEDGSDSSESEDMEEKKDE